MCETGTLKMPAGVDQQAIRPCSKALPCSACRWSCAPWACHLALGAACASSAAPAQAWRLPQAAGTCDQQRRRGRRPAAAPGRLPGQAGTQHVTWPAAHMSACMWWVRVLDGQCLVDVVLHLQLQVSKSSHTTSRCNRPEGVMPTVTSDVSLSGAHACALPARPPGNQLTHQPLLFNHYYYPSVLVNPCTYHPLHVPHQSTLLCLHPPTSPTNFTHASTH